MLTCISPLSMRPDIVQTTRCDSAVSQAIANAASGSKPVSRSNSFNKARRRRRPSFHVAGTLSKMASQLFGNSKAAEFWSLHQRQPDGSSLINVANTHQRVNR